MTQEELTNYGGMSMKDLTLPYVPHMAQEELTNLESQEKLLICIENMHNENRNIHVYYLIYE